MKQILVIVFFFSLGISSAQNCNDMIHRGEGTYYDGIDGTSNGNCSLPIALGDYFYCAMNAADYNDSAACGTCVEVEGFKGKVTLKVVDQCPECKPGDIDMTVQAFGQIEEVVKGRIPIQWKYVPCDTKEETIKINFKEGSSQYWTAIQFRDIAYGIASMEYRMANGSWKIVNRSTFNFFIETSGIMPPMDLRITSVNNEQLVFENIPIDLSADYDTGAQFSIPSDCNLGTNPVATKSKSGSAMIYPNPARTSFYISGQSDAKYELFNVNGMLLKSGVVSSDNQIVEVSDLPRGLYYINILNNMTPVLLK